MLWKVFAVDTGKIVKAGFRSQDEAEEWLEQKSDYLSDEYEVDEMDSDEEEDWLERVADSEDGDEDELESDEDSDYSFDMNYDSDDDAEDNSDPDDLSIIMDDDLDL